MVLYAEHLIFLALHAFHCTVQQIHVGHGQFCCADTVAVHSIGVVLGSNFDFPGFQIADRMIAAPVSEFQLISFCAVGQRR